MWHDITVITCRLDTGHWRHWSLHSSELEVPPRPRELTHPVVLENFEVGWKLVHVGPPCATASVVSFLSKKIGCWGQFQNISHNFSLAAQLSAFERPSSVDPYLFCGRNQTAHIKTEHSQYPIALSLIQLQLAPFQFGTGSFVWVYFCLCDHHHVFPFFCFPRWWLRWILKNGVTVVKPHAHRCSFFLSPAKLIAGQQCSVATAKIKNPMHSF